MSHVTRRESGSRKTASKAGRKNGSTRRSTWIMKRSSRAIRFSSALPVSGGGRPKPGPGSLPLAKGRQIAGRCEAREEEVAAALDRHEPRHARHALAHALGRDRERPAE